MKWQRILFSVFCPSFLLLVQAINAQQQACWSGTWVGTYSWTTSGGNCSWQSAGNITMTLLVTNGVVTGSGTEDGVVCINEKTCEIRGYGTLYGPLSGTVTGNTISLTGNLTNSCNGVSYVAPFSGTLTGCTISGSPNLTMTRQSDCDTCRAAPIITWNNLAAINYGTPLSSLQLNATANVAGNFDYTPSSGTVLNIGNNALSVTFTPADKVDYTTITATASLVVLPATTVQPGITAISILGGNLVINGTNGVSGTTYYLMMSTNIALPVNQWIPVATNTLNGNGSFTLAATNAVYPNVPQQFYILKSQ